MPTHLTSSDAPSWRRPNQPSSPPQPVSAHSQRDLHAHRKDKDKPHENWRVHAQPVAAPSKSHQYPSLQAQPLSISAPRTKPARAHASSCTSASASTAHQTEAIPSLLSTSLNREKSSVLDAHWVPGRHPHPDPNAPHAIKPSGIGNGIIGRAPEFGTSPIKTKGAAFPAIRPHWPLSSSLEKHVNSGPATHLHPLRIEPNERSRFFPSASTPLKPNQNNYSALKSHSSLYSHDRDENWMLTPTSSLPSIPSTPNHLRESSTERLLAATPQLAPPPHTPNARPLPSIRGPVDQFQASLNSAPRTPSPSYPFGRPDPAHAGPSLFNRGPSVNVLSSPKRSPLVVSAYPHRQQATTATANPVLLSPTSSPKLSHRTLSPMTRLPPAIPESHLPTSSDRVVNSIASMLSSVSPQPRPCSASRRDSFNSVTSASAGHALSHSRRSSAVFSPNSPTVSTRVGVYRPPHLRNRDSVSGLKPSVAHYDRVRTPSLRGLSRSRESSISLSRPTSRPPSTVPFHHSESIPEDGQADDAARTLLRGRQSNLSIHLPDLIAEEQLRNAAAAAAVSATSVSDNDHNDSFVANTTHLLEQPLDSASLLAKLRAQLVRREAAASDAAASDADRNSVILDDNGHEFFDLSEMMEYGASDIHPLSRCSSMSAIEGPPLGDVFEIGDLLGPGLEHDGHIIQIAETTPGFVDQNEDLTGSKLEVVRKLGEGSYAVVYLVKEVSAQEAASNPLQKSVAIPSSSSRNTNTDLEASSKNLDDDADLTMVASSEDMLSTTLKANANAKDQGFHNSPALEERRRKDLKINTHMRPGKEFALKCLCKRDLPEDMLEVQRLEATIHQSIPSHPNIVTLYRTYETPDWLFLVLEYCPGQDLYYWLEQAQDEGRPAEPAGNMYANTFVDRDEVAATLKGSSTASSDDNYRVLGTSLDATPPSPSLLASTSGHSLLSKRRIRLIARMFRQICDAVQFCHDRGVSHRDIKPENFIVEDRRTLEEMQSACPDTSASTLVDGFRDGDETQVIVKMTDFGLATAEDRCDDFDCGSKPYMAFECHNNISSSYDPKQADIWSLGVVLLNLLFHRSPFTEPSMSCPSFSAYCQDPIRFLMESFDGLTETVARFLSENVFCSISDDDDVTQKRISAGEFSRWACSLVDHMGLSGPGSGRISRGASIHSTIPLIHSRTASMSTLPSLLSSPRPRARSLARDTDHIPDLDVTADATFRAAFAAAATRQGNMFPNPALFTPDVLPSPTFTPSPHPPEQNPFDTQYGAAEEAARCTETSVEQEEHDNSGHLHNSAFDSPSGANVAKRQTINPDSLGSERINPVTHPASEGKEGAHDISNNLLDTEVSADISSPKKSDVPVEAEPAPASSDTGGEGDVPDEAEQVTSADGGGGALGETEDGDKAESITMSNHSKRRKRGARKGRTLAKQLKRSQSVEGMTEADANDPAAKARERERTIRELALASETLARQMSKMTKPSDSIDVLVSPQITLSKPTAEAAARFNLQGLVDAEVESANMRVAKSGDDGLAANWSSAAMRRERMSEQRKTGVAALQDSGRSRVMSWRERNQSAATLSSVASSAATSISSHSSITSATSSIYSTASAPAALTRKDFSSRNRTRGSGFGLDTISEREKTESAKKEVDAKYLAGIFGGGDNLAQGKKRKEESQRAAPSQQCGESAAAQAGVSVADKGETKGTKLFGLLTEGSSNGSKENGVMRSTSASSTKWVEPSSRLATIEAGVNGSAQRSVSISSVTSNSSSSGVAASFVSRFRRPATSSSSLSIVATTTSKANGSDAGGGFSDRQAQTFEAGRLESASLGMRRDVSTSTSSLHHVKHDETSATAREVVPTLSNGSCTISSVKTTEVGSSDSNDAASSSVSASASASAPVAAAAAVKKRSMGKFLLGVRDSIKNF